MHQSDEHHRLRERYLLALIEATFPIQQGAADPELTLGLLIQASDLLKEHLQRELQGLREGSD